MKADEIISMLTTFLTISNLEPTEENKSFELNLSVAGKVDSTTIAESFRTEQRLLNAAIRRLEYDRGKEETHYPVQQRRRDVAARTKETGLTIRLGQSPRRPKAGSPTCAHCQKAHKSEDCYTKHPEKMPQWMKDRNEEQHKR
ncbi:hypothetical protein M407DRAFT_25093 [Tulasnella calospora MUT 4182]|uniref:Uncharacterized protein n=1 Tax=Tulasnella calospora MUT 4182 TaxID=1051891 RepID=A0A0C3KVT1_9AGAM|nr:hypothetical protein M407DRAFT_25093 [Tulasnella calospora MUT 4182]